MTRDQYLATGAGIVIVVLLFLFSKAPNNYVTNKLGDLNVSPINNSYSLPPLDLPGPNPYRGGPWDWMQTTSLGCSCDLGLNQTIILPTPPQPRRQIPAFAYIAPRPVISPSLTFPASVPAPVFSYPAYEPPRLTYRKRTQGIFFMSYTDGTGPVHNGFRLPLFVIETSDGEILNAYTRRFATGSSGSIVYGASRYYPATDADRV